MPATWKDPSDVFDYSLDFSPDLATGEVITAVVSVTATNVATEDDSTTDIIRSAPTPAVSSPNVTFWLQGGNVGERHSIEVVVSTDQGRRYTGVLVLDVFEL
jgi:hypothetical protein